MQPVLKVYLLKGLWEMFLIQQLAILGFIVSMTLGSTVFSVFLSNFLENKSTVCLSKLHDTITSNVCSVQWTVIKNTAASSHRLSAVESRDTHYVEKEFKLEASVMPLPWSSENPLESRMKDSRSHGPLNQLSRTLWVHEGLRGKHRLTSVCTRFSVYMLLL